MSIPGLAGGREIAIPYRHTNLNLCGLSARLPDPDSPGCGAPADRLLVLQFP